MATKKATVSKKTSASQATKTTVTTTAAAASTKNTFIGHVQQSVRTASFWQAFGAELVGTFLFAGAIIAGQGSPLVVLFALAGLVLIIGAISGAHVNPAITIGAWVTKRIGWLRAVAYIIAQVLGAALAFVVLSNFLAGSPTNPQAQLLGQGAPELFKAASVATFTGKEWYVFFAEVLGTGILAFAVANATRELQDRVAAALTVGLGIFIAVVIAAGAAAYVGGSAIINPAVAVALQAFNWSEGWSFAIYALAPVVGGIIGFVIYDLLRGERTILSK